MRIIFENKEERNNFFGKLRLGSITCPSDIGLNDSVSCGGNSDCEQCWSQSVAWEVKEPEA